MEPAAALALLVTKLAVHTPAFGRPGGAILCTGYALGDPYDLGLSLPLSPSITHDAAMQLHPRLSTDYVVYDDYATPRPRRRISRFRQHPLTTPFSGIRRHSCAG